MKLELVVRTELSHLDLLKDEKKVIGIKIRDGTNEEAGPAIKKIKAKSPAGRSFATCEGDVILSVNGQSTSGRKYKDVRRMIKNAGPQVSLQLQYKAQEVRISRSGVYRKQYLTITLPKENGSFGFVLRKKDSTEHRCFRQFPVISNIKEKRNNQLQDGDRLLSVDDLNLSWLSLDEIATILQDKDEAEFIFEYNIRIFDFMEPEQKIDLEIDVPFSDLGLNFCMYSDDSLYIDSIRAGSIAERCGVFSVGDVILSINGIETNFLTLSKADFLLQTSKKVRKISFIKIRQMDSDAMSISDQTETSSIASGEAEMATTATSTSGIDTEEWKHVNTPANSNMVFSAQQNYYSQKFCHVEQIKAIHKFQHMVPVMSSLEYHLSRLTDEAFNGNQNTLNENCSFCDNIQHSVKLCTSCLVGMNDKCSQSMDLLKSVIVQFVNSSTNTKSLPLQSVIGREGERGHENQSTKFPVRSLVTTMTETLPKVFGGVHEEILADLAEKVRNADTSCSTCDFEVKSLMLIVQKLLLLLSLKVKNEEITNLIDLLLNCLLKTKFTCDGESEDPHSPADNECSISPSENVSDREVLQDEENLSLPTSSNFYDSVEFPPSEIQSSSESIFKRPRLNTSTNPEYLKIAYIQSVSESQNSISVKEIDKANAGSASSLVEKGCHEVMNLASPSMLASSKEPINKGLELQNFVSLNEVDKTNAVSASFVKKRACIRDNSLKSLSASVTSKEPVSILNKKINKDKELESQNSCFTNEIGSFNADSGSLFQEDANWCEVNNLGNPPPSVASDESSSHLDKEICKGLRLPQTVWKSMGSFLRSKYNSKIRTVIQNGCQSTPNHCKATESSDVNDPTSGMPSNTHNLSTDSLVTEGENISQSDGSSSRSFRSVSEYESNHGRKKEKKNSVHSETMEVKLKNDGDGFGLGLSLQIIHDNGMVIPVIHAIKPNSPSHKTGIIKVDDRVVAINHKSTLGLTTKDLMYLKNGAFSAESIIITIEFDVIDEEPKFGIFDVVLNRTLKTGLIFKAMKRGSPMVVSGVVKGSAAHRCGELFAGDKIMFIKCNRNEDFDAITCSYIRKYFVRMTVQRDRPQGKQKKSVDAPPYYINPCFSYEDFVPRNGRNFAVKRTAIRAVESTEALVFDQEVTLFRDPKFSDFGFLVGQNRETGRAYVADIRPDGPAHQSGVLKQFDRIVEVNGVPVDGNVETSVLALLSHANHQVDLLIRRLYSEQNPK